eukprot:evm.model.NODE_29797_length_44057_cov_23.302427.3
MTNHPLPSHNLSASALTAHEARNCSGSSGSDSDELWRRGGGRWRGGCRPFGRAALGQGGGDMSVARGGVDAPGRSDGLLGRDRPRYDGVHEGVGAAEAADGRVLEAAFGSDFSVTGRYTGVEAKLVDW